MRHRQLWTAASNRTSLTAPDGSIGTYGYDSLNRLNGLANSWAGSFSFGYDALSRRTQLTRPNGVNTNYSYDSLSHLLSVLHQTGTNTLDGASYTYDPAGNRTSKGSYLNGTTSNYTYDPLYELTQVTQGGSTTESYSYDPVGNRLSSSGVPNYSYNASNELTSNSSGSYTYDANGNTLTDASGKSYTWDLENRLTQVVNPGVGTTSFRYDPFGRRIQKSGPLGTTNYLYDGNGENVIEEVDSNGNVLARYTERVLDEPFAELRSGTTSYYQQDGLDSVTSLTTSTGVLANSYAFDSFGNLTVSTGSITNPFRFTGRDFDSETGLYFYRARYLDSSTGRFLSEDPIQFAGDGPNFFAYTLNNPVIYFDPMGTSTQGPPPPPTPGLPGTWGGPEPGGWIPNAPPPQTGPLSGPALNLANCMAHALGRYFVVTGGSECTPDGRHVPGGVKGSKHCTNQAIDIRPAGQDQHSLFCAALNCGAQNIINEGDHYHMQTVRGPGGAQGLLPKGCDCPSPK